MASPKHLEILGEEDCQNTLEKFLGTKNFQIASFEVKDFHNPYQGLVGEHFTLEVRYVRENKQECDEFFVKSVSTNPLMSTFSKEILVYEKEKFFYELLDEYRKYNIDTSFAPRGLFFKPRVVVLEDLSRGYKGSEKRQPLDLEQCRSCLQTIAKFHASSIIYERKKSEELGKKFSLNDDNSEILEDKLASTKECLASKFMSCSLEGVFTLIDLVLEGYRTNEELKTKLVDVVSQDTDDEGLISGLLHGDLWTSNFLYSYHQDGKISDTKLLDFQMIKYGPLELDVAEFLMSNTTHSFRLQHFDPLVEHCHAALSQSLSAAGLRPHDVQPPTPTFVTSCNNFKLAGKIHAVVDHSYTFMADEIYGDVMKSEESFKKFLFEERSRYIIESYNENEAFKKVLCQDIVELRDLLFS